MKSFIFQKYEVLTSNHMVHCKMIEIQRQIEEEPLVTSCATGDYLKNSPNLNNNNKITDIDSITNHGSLNSA